MNATIFHQRFGDEADYWGGDSTYTVEAWQQEVTEDNTRLGYWDWVLNEKEIAALDNE